MKKIMLFLGIVLMMLSCADNEKVTNTDLYIYLDYTEGQDYTEQLDDDVDKYLTLMNITEKSDRGSGKVRLFPLHDVSSSVSKSVKLKEGLSKMEGNKYIRKKELDEFKAKLMKKAEDINTTYTGKPLKHSHIFNPLCKGIKKMSHSNADRKVIVIYSDMLENSDLANFHSKKLSYDQLKTQFDSACDLDDVSDVEIYIVHPVDKHNDKKIRMAENFWSKYLIEKGLDSEMWHFETGIDI